MAYFCMYFSSFLSNFKPSFFHFTRSRSTNNEDKTQDIIVLVQDNKHRLHCIQDGLPQDSFTASSYRLLDRRTLEGHVVLLDPSFCHQIVDQLMLVNHILDLTGFYQFHYEAGRILPDQDRTEYHDPVEDPLPVPLPAEPGLRQ